MRIGRIGRPPAKPRSSEQRLRAARVTAARRNTRWLEIEDDLVARDNGRVFVSARSDLAYQPARGALFERGSARIVAEFAQLYFVVRDDSELVVFERMPSAWSDQVAARERRRARAAT